MILIMTEFKEWSDRNWWIDRRERLRFEHKLVWWNFRTLLQILSRSKGLNSLNFFFSILKNWNWFSYYPKKKQNKNKKDAEIVSKHAGLRPSRKGGIRIESELVKRTKVVHNYGHGGSGVTLCWGCASDVVALIKDEEKNSKSKL